MSGEGGKSELAAAGWCSPSVRHVPLTCDGAVTPLWRCSAAGGGRSRKLGMGSFEGSRIRAIFLRSTATVKYQAPSQVIRWSLSSKEGEELRKIHYTTLKGDKLKNRLLDTS